MPKHENGIPMVPRLAIVGEIGRTTVSSFGVWRKLSESAALFYMRWHMLIREFFENKEIVAMQCEHLASTPTSPLQVVPNLLTGMNSGGIHMHGQRFLTKTPPHQFWKRCPTVLNWSAADSCVISSSDKTGFHLKRGSDVLKSFAVCMTTDKGGLRHALESELFPLS
jgi:hypothetical protein